MNWRMIKETLKRNALARVAYHFFYYVNADFRSGRMRGIFFTGLANLLPDWQAFAFLRPWLWCVAGAQIDDCSSSVIRAKVFVEYPRNLVVGHHFHVNRDTYLGSAGRIMVGNYVTISVGCRVLTMGHAGARHEIEVVRDVTLKDHCIVYAGVTILPGTTVERYVVVAAGAVLRGETKPGGIYAGVPAVFKGYRKDIDTKLFMESVEV